MKKKLINYLIYSLVVILNISYIYCHGMLMDPVNRGSAWRLGFNTPVNYDDNANYCGGANIHHSVNHGKCGACGDDYRDSVPRKNENGGYYGTGVIVKNYTEGQEFIATVKITANHRGYFEFSICSLDDINVIENDECFDNHPVETIDGNLQWKLPTNESREFDIGLVLPAGLTCQHCSLRWNYVTANSWGICKNQTGAVGCGPQETFRTCSDIKIL
ncbi:hypothetical protein HCN44_010582 [Aphidius gifuensis]|uniref:Chitin-binding type-4 domain-containing protein n=1 Tax=Aphidius gifuensis TaxID=684658 RepID=A0A834XS31_APHGI|nr:uncharacterized protein LOC122855694 [Aphidius gifuensis]KAF7991781.1 hypothetical protein HCN44_010582 [Aphidius gifuensis]